MAEYPNSVKRGLEQMQSAAAAAPHPDADLLTAFAEQTLTTAERENVLTHLATCAGCRHVVSLSLPQQPPAIPQAAPVKPLFWRWPVLRWGAVAASAVIVAVAVSIGNIEHNRTKQAIEKINSDAASVPAVGTPGGSAKADEPHLQLPVSGGIQRQKVRYEKVPGPAAGRTPETKAASGLVRRDENQPAAAPLAKDKAQRAAGLNSMNAAELEPKTADRTDAFVVAGTAPKPAAVPPPPPASTNETVNVGAQAGPVQVETSGGSVRGSLPTPSAKKSLAYNAAAAPQRDALSLRKRERFAAPTNWQVTSAGVLQRSFDRGQTWEQALPDSNFRAVTTIGNEIWAGGANGLLMHSTDAGQNWTTANPGLHGDVTSLRFSDSRHGLAKTSANETWQTEDGGKTWNRQ